MSEANTSDAVSEANTSDAASAETESGREDALIRVVKGHPDDVELAALVAVLTAAVSAAPAGPGGGARPPETWGEPTLMHRGTPPYSPYAYPALSHLRG